MDFLFCWIVVEQLSIPSSLKDIKNRVVNLELATGVSKKNAPIGQYCQAIAEVDERNILIIMLVLWHQDFNCFQLYINLYQTKLAICCIEKVWIAIVKV